MLTFVCLMMVFNPTFNNISVIGGGNWSTHRKPLTCHWQTLSHNIVHLALIEIRTHNISGDCIGSCKSNYHTNMATTANPDVKVHE
jgi:hypothetical protein